MNYFVTEILPNLFVGSVESAQYLKDLKTVGITHIIVAADGLNAKFPGNFEYFKTELIDSIAEDIIPTIHMCTGFIHGALSNEKNKVLVHCRAGISRSTSIVIGYLMFTMNIDYDEAFNFVKSKHHETQPNQGYKACLNRIYFPCKIVNKNNN
jgi:hypothetical protein